ncbi:MAG: DUF4417 domain-containing protein [Candidatus Saccharibacteria bacterium]|nr:DUF4417 domain-containing protein [Candidatus Saccharibacteria bacterium]
MTKKKSINMNDGFNSGFVKNAHFDGQFEIPIIEPMNEIIFPKLLVPFSKRNYVKNLKEAFVCFYENDDLFTDIIRDPDGMIEDLRRFGGIIAPDNSLALDSPFSCQLLNVYRRNAIACHLQESGIPVIANPRWSDERTYSTCVFPEPIAFLGCPKQNIVCIGSHGSVKGDDYGYCFREGLRAMLDYLEPKYVLVYGPMPKQIFDEFRDRASFIQYDEWAKICHGRG